MATSIIIKYVRSCLWIMTANLAQSAGYWYLSQGILLTHRRPFANTFVAAESQGLRRWDLFR